MFWANEGREWIRGLQHYAARHRILILTAIGTAVVGAGLATLLPVLEQKIIDSFVSRPGTFPAAFVLALVLAGSLQFLAQFARAYSGAKATLHIQCDIRDDLVDSAHNFDAARLQEVGTGTILESATRDVDLIEGFLDPLPAAVGNVVLLIGSCVVMVLMSPILALISVILIPLAAASVHFTRKKISSAARESRQRSAELTGMVNERVAGISVIKSYAQEDREAAAIESAAKTILTTRTRSISLTAIATSFMGGVPTFGQVGVFALGAVMAINHQISVGTLVAFLSFLTQIVGSTRSLSGLIGFAFDATAGLNRVFTLIGTKPVTKDGTIVLPKRTHGAQLAVDRVSFGYQAARPVLRDVSLEAGSGALVAVVGAVGSGKSTLIQLITRAYDPTTGSLRLDGIDLSELRRSSLRAAVAAVYEDPALADATVADNITSGQGELTSAKVRAATAAACVDEFVSAMPEGYGSSVGEAGSALSGGQRQRIALARAIVRQPRLLLFDNATSAVDPATEARIHDYLINNLTNTTRILVTYRRATLQAADAVVLMDRGTVVDFGTHDELTSRSRRYRRLIEHANSDSDPRSAGVHVH